MIIDLWRAGDIHLRARGEPKWDWGGWRVVPQFEEISGTGVLRMMMRDQTSNADGP